ncbi:MAG: hypothetical protein NC120_12420 [Ruminococcus sp.]|nr:hypothetical protein [Ruminococcus sp.]
MYTIHHKVCKPVKINGKWDLEDYEYDEEIPDEQVRHCNVCTVCGMSSYPECTKTCIHGGLIDYDTKTEQSRS